jgi:hypothetical protein
MTVNTGANSLRVQVALGAFGVCGHSCRSPSGDYLGHCHALGLVLIAEVYIGFRMADGAGRSSQPRLPSQQCCVVAGAAITGTIGC